MLQLWFEKKPMPLISKAETHCCPGQRLTSRGYMVCHAAGALLCGQRFGGHVRDYSFKKRSRPFAYNGEANTAVSYDTPTFFRGLHTQVGC